MRLSYIVLSLLVACPTVCADGRRVPGAGVNLKAGTRCRLRRPHTADTADNQHRYKLNLNMDGRPRRGRKRRPGGRCRRPRPEPDAESDDEDGSDGSDTIETVTFVEVQTVTAVDIQTVTAVDIQTITIVDIQTDTVVDIQTTTVVEPAPPAVTVEVTVTPAPEVIYATITSTITQNRTMSLFCTSQTLCDAELAEIGATVLVPWYPPAVSVYTPPSSVLKYSIQCNSSIS
ncbi:hypothetical protein CANCADRAFT_139835 [Tortispora caseinolytica NRRL Y-17796]|uniref:Uncharacterized protein n=1 Tax=Tortispora caseinolytica NRRL Y-17796 TaxID=767744 RepID=A0A1E4TCU4_9ASCO|nr:hypothetical protein CANCADRAFT_139835 [Tortispora caseinolytica NRRL Y-17796]